MHPALPTLRPHELTAVLLQFAGTNVAAAELKSFYFTAQQHALTLLPSCSLQQVADITWALHRAQAAVSAAFYKHVTDFAATWLEQRLVEEDTLHVGVPIQPDTRSLTHSNLGSKKLNCDIAQEAANFLYRIRHIADVREALGGGIITGMLRIVSKGASHVRPCLL